MRSLVAALRTMHLVETIAVALYQGPQAILRRQNRALYRSFVAYEKAELRHRCLFLAGLHSQGTTPWFFSAGLAALAYWLVYLLTLGFGLKALLYFEIVIERIAIRHYGKILRAPEPWQARVREVQKDEILHLAALQGWLAKLQLSRSGAQ